MKEIEVKAQIHDFSPLIEKLEALGCSISLPLMQKDAIYLAKGVELSDVRRRHVVMRIRSENGICTLTLKKNLENELDCIEHETIIQNPQEAHNMLIQMGYREVLRVEKNRRACSYRAMNICIDEVQGLGNFVEVERMSEDADGPAVQEELFQFLESLGVKREDRVFRGYDTLLYEKLHGT